jgi:hypothetical protein
VSLPKLYLETTIPSYLTARRSKDSRLAADQETTEEWWRERRAGYELFVSATVLREAAGGSEEYARARMNALRGLPQLVETPESEALAERLLVEGVIPIVAAPDAVHLALAAVHGMDFLLTWNCKHIHNPHLERRIEASCRALGFTPPVICTPADLMQT